MYGLSTYLDQRFVELCLSADYSVQL